MNYIANGSAMDTLLYGLQVALLGMGTVFSVLILLWLVLMIFQFIFSPKKNSPKKQNSTSDTPVVASVKSVVESVSSDEDETELIAVIMAAVYACSGAAPGSLRMVSCKRQKTPWNRK